LFSASQLAMVWLAWEVRADGGQWTLPPRVVGIEVPHQEAVCRYVYGGEDGRYWVSSSRGV